jgi:putative membrane protein
VGLLKFIGWLATNAVALAAACVIFDGIGFTGSSGWDEVTDNVWGLLFVALILGIVNAFISPIIKFLSLPFIIITLGLMLFVINAFMLLFTSWIAEQLDLGFHVDGFWTAVWGSIVISIASMVLNAIFPSPSRR